MSSTRDKILETILNHQRATIIDLADSVGINPISVRHHISRLEAEGLVSSDDERHGVGRPRRYYFLTEDGMESFPTRYLTLTTRLLEQIKSSLPEDTVASLFTQLGSEMAHNAIAEVDLSALSMEERLDVLIKFLENEGFSVTWEKVNDQFHIKELSCPYYQVGQSHPEVCSVDRAMISNFLDVPATRVKCILDGDTHCTYVVPVISVEDIPIAGR
ncbi:MAG TPA: winged helix-turn-helix transcriptional regulator [Anaerolineales bacterium]|nr:winged helix-turn-helix transcriptional regulator [Anaerolineales bacterium]